MVASTAAGTTTTSTPAVPAVAIATEVKLMPVKDHLKQGTEDAMWLAELSSLAQNILALE
jgi:hypothetical protein